MVTKRPASQCLGRFEFIIYIQKYKRECIYACIFVCIVFTLCQGPEQEPGTNPVLCLVVQSCLSLCDPMDCSSPGSAVHGDSPGKNTGVGSHSPSPGDLPNPGIKPRSPSGRFFTVWATREALLQPNWLLVSSHPSGLTSVLLVARHSKVEGKDRDFKHAKVRGSWVNYLNSGRLCCIIRIRKQQSILGMVYLILFNPQNVSFDMKFQIPTEHSENTGFLPPSVILCKAFTSCLSKSRVLLCSHHGLPALLN